MRVAQGAGDFEAGRNAGDAVEAAARRHRVAMRSDRDDAERRIFAFEAPDQIAGGIDANCKSCLGEAVSQPRAAFQKQRTERAARVGALGLGDFRQRHDVGPEAVGVERQRGGHLHVPLQCAGSDGATNLPAPGAPVTRPSSMTQAPRTNVATTRNGRSMPSYGLHET